jgi:hypothetical protein
MVQPTLVTLAVLHCVLCACVEAYLAAFPLAAPMRWVYHGVFVAATCDALVVTLCTPPRVHTVQRRVAGAWVTTRYFEREHVAAGHCAPAA